MKDRLGGSGLPHDGARATPSLEEPEQKGYNRRNMHDLLFDFISKYVSLSENERNAILSLDIFRSVKKGTILLKEGEHSQDGYFVLKGCIRTYYVINGEEKTTAFYTEMEGLTPHCVTNKQPSEYYLACVEDAILTVATPDMETEIFEKFPKFETLCRILSEELLARQQIDFDKFKTSSPEQRYLNLLHNRPDLLQRVPQHQLASYLGITPQSLSRLRARIAQNVKG
jgi:CRP-like cAMP-binding protein